MQGHQIVKITFLVVALAFIAFAAGNITHYYGCWGQTESAEQSD